MAGVKEDVTSLTPQGQPQRRPSVNGDRIKCCVFDDLTCREMTLRVGLEVKHQSIHNLIFLSVRMKTVNET